MMGEYEHENEMAIVLPEWTHDDFLTEEPYRWLFQYRDSQFTLQRLLARAGDAAKAQNVNVKDFQKMWKLYECERVGRTQVVGNYVTAFSGQPTQLVAGIYRCEDDGVSRIDEKGRTVEVISHPIMPTGRNVDITTGNQFYNLAYKRGKEEWRTLRNVPQEVISNAQKIVTLSNRGPAITSTNEKEVISFLNDIISRNYDDLPCGRITSRLGWTDSGEFIPYDDSVSYDENGSFLRQYNAVRCEGNPEKWINALSVLRKPTTLNAPFRIYLAGSFASVLAGKLGILPCIIHIVAPTGAGKTVAMQLAASVWADPEAWLQSLSSTTTANELTAGFVHDLPLMLDELQTVAESRNGRDRLQSIIYNLAEGIGKGRGNKDGGLRRLQRWNCFTFTTGEQSLTDDRSHGGAVQRVIELRARKGFIPYAREASAFAKNNFGWAGKMFVEYLLKLSPEEWKKIKREHSDISDDLQSKGVASKQADSAAAIILADRLAEQVVFQDGYVLSVDDLIPYLKNAKEIDINRRCYEYILGWLDENQSHFIRSKEIPTVTYGKIISEKGDTPTQYHILAKSLNDELAEAGFDRKSFIEWAKDEKRGIVKTENSREDGTVIRDGKRVYNFFRVDLKDDTESAT